MMMGFRDNVLKCQEYIRNLEDERSKIQVFQRELPLCLELVTQAIETCKQQLIGSGTSNAHSECSEQTMTSSDGPVLEEFIPLKMSNSTDDEHQQESGKKSDWLRSVQLWNPDPNSDPEVHEHQPKRVSVVEVKKNSGGAFHPFHKENGSNDNNINKPTSSVSACSSGEAVVVAVAGTKEDKCGSESQRKSRRCWSPELHKTFLHSLQQLGGPHVATPKQIRELMKVDRLTNDEVKSHLQKYRLHTRRPSTSTVPHNNPNPQPSQFVITGGIWVSPSEYQTTMASPMSVAGSTSSSPQKKQPNPSDQRRDY